MVINSKWRRSLQDVRVYRGADANSDHYLVVATVGLKLRQAPRQKQARQTLDTAKLKTPDVKREFVIELRDLASLSDPDEEDIHCRGP